MSFFNRVATVIKAGRELGFERMGRYALYQLQLRSGYLARRVSDGRSFTQLPDKAFSIYPVMNLPGSSAVSELLGADGQYALLVEAEEIISGRVRLFGAEPVALNLGPGAIDSHWTKLESGRNSTQGDIKFIWEPARFGWAFILGRAYRVSGDERYPAVFWDYLEQFTRSNPPYYGHHWRSAQEVALRLIALVFAAQVFDSSQSSTPARVAALGRAIAAHAGRIPPSMAYARSQNNNHLLVEAVGLYTAASVLQNHPSADGWRELGWRWAQRALQSQINDDGVYMQQSANYHRLMLHASLWLNCLARYRGEAFPPQSLERLQAATGWLLALLDEVSGQAPNLGPNDGANILPLSCNPYRDYRPVLQAALGAFEGARALPGGLWDETALWLGVDLKDASPVYSRSDKDRKAPLLLRSNDSWAYLRAERFTERPGHADQLHLDLWWRGFNVAQDAGTYLYNAAPPWDNALSRSLVHNTVTVNDLDQMTWAGRFLWLDWAQASQVQRQKAADGSWERALAVHNGYRGLGVIHRRSVTAIHPNSWRVEDELVENGKRKSASGENLRFRLHWLIPDWQWKLERIDHCARLLICAPEGEITLLVKCESELEPLPGLSIQLVRAGEVLLGEGTALPVLGWFSPSYGIKNPALSFALSLSTRLPLKFISEWTFPKA
jgi:hypothetical protein